LTLVPTTLKGERPKNYNPLPTTLGEYFRKRRVELGLFQREVAANLSVDPWTYLNWEQDRTHPARRFWPRVVAFLGYDPERELAVPTAGGIPTSYKGPELASGAVD